MTRKTLGAVVAVLLVGAVVATASVVQALGGTEVYVRMALIPSVQQKKQLENLYRDVMNKAQFRVVRANVSGVTFARSEDDEILAKARNVEDPEEFVKFLTRRGEWSVVGENGEPVFPFKYVRKTVMDTKGETPAVAVLLSRPAAGAAGINDGDTFNATMIWDGEEIPLTAKVGDKGKALLLTNPDWTVTQAWRVRAILTLGPYPCEVKVKDFKYGDDILKQIFG